MAKDVLDGFDKFTAQVMGRLQQGRAEYGDGSFDAPALKLVEELDEELMDIMGWGYILHCRLDKIRQKLKLLHPLEEKTNAS